jgi:hypothetical protein
MKLNSFNKRLAVLEEIAKPLLIATLADFVLWRAKGCTEEVEFTPAMKEAIPMSSKMR